MNPKSLRAEGERLIAEALAAADRGELEKARLLMARGQMRVEASVLLQTGERAITVGKMDAAISRSIGQADETDEYVKELHARGFTITSAARKANVSQAMVSMALRGQRVLSDAKRKAMEDATGVPFPTTRRQK